jgi:hypothetical protein
VIEEKCFCECLALKEVVFEEGSNLKKIGRKAFWKCGIEHIRIPWSVKIIEAHCFSGGELYCKVVIENGVNLKEVGMEAFVGCEKYGENVQK